MSHTKEVATGTPVGMKGFVVRDPHLQVLVATAASAGGAHSRYLSMKYLSDAAMGRSAGSVTLGIHRWHVKCMSRHLSTPWHIRSSSCTCTSHGKDGK